MKNQSNKYSFIFPENSDFSMTGFAYCTAKCGAICGRKEKCSINDFAADLSTYCINYIPQQKLKRKKSNAGKENKNEQV